jgi:iron complex outermembrane recepter protein
VKRAAGSRWVAVVCAAVSGAATVPGVARAQVVAAEPWSPVAAPFPEGTPPLEVQITLQLVVDAAGRVESAVVVSRLPAEAPAAFDEAAARAARSAAFQPSTRDGRPFRSRVEYVVVFHPPPPLPSPPAAPAPNALPSPVASTSEQDEDYAQVVQVHGVGWSSPRGVGDVRLKRELLDAAPHQQTSEMLAAAPGFFVDHEDGEGFGNDVVLRGFDLDHGAGIEMRVGNVPINIPMHVQGQGYADANFILPEVVRSIRVLEGPFDPRQGDAAIVGSAYFDLGVVDRGEAVEASYGSFQQRRFFGRVAPRGADEETFAAFAYRKTDGFGQSRTSESGTANAQYGFDVGPRDHVRLLAAAYATRASLPGVVREDDVDAGRIDLYGRYPHYADGQGIQSALAMVSADFDHVASGGARYEFAPWVLWTSFRARENFSGNIYASQIDPSVAGLGDLWETTNVETAAGLTTRFHSAAWRPLSWLDVAAEPGVTLRVGHTEQTKSLLAPSDFRVWDRRADDGLDTVDVGGYVDLDARAWRRLRLSGGVRADLLAVSIDDRLANTGPAALVPAGALPGARRAAQGLAVGPRVTLEYDPIPEIAPVVSYGEGFRSLDAGPAPSALGPTPAGAASLAPPGVQEGSVPYSKIRSVEAGVRMQALRQRYTASVSFFQTWVENEVVFDPSAGGLTTEGASTRRGVVASLVAKPAEWALVAAAASVTRATFDTNVGGTAHFVPNVPPVLLRVDATAHGKLFDIAGRSLTGRIGVGYTFLAGRRLTDTITGPANHVLNANGGLRYAFVELAVDAFNVLDRRYADQENVFVSNWSVKPGTALASTATHLTAAPPMTVIGTLAVYF